LAVHTFFAFPPRKIRLRFRCRIFRCDFRKLFILFRGGAAEFSAAESFCSTAIPQRFFCRIAAEIFRFYYSFTILASFGYRCSCFDAKHIAMRAIATISTSFA